jgi:hypothetical protein
MRDNRSGEIPTLSGAASVNTGDFFNDLVWAFNPTEKINEQTKQKTIVLIM